MVNRNAKNAKNESQKMKRQKCEPGHEKLRAKAQSTSMRQ